MMSTTTTVPKINNIRSDLILIPLAGGTFGFVSGLLISSRLASRQFLAENAHRLPTTVQGWYFYQKTKNYRVLYSGLLGGLQTGARLGLWTASFIGLQEIYQVQIIERMKNRFLQRDEREALSRTRWLSGASAGITIAFVAGRIYRLSRFAAPRRYLLGASLGLVSGGTYDLRDWIKTRLPPSTSTIAA